MNPFLLEAREVLRVCPAGEKKDTLHLCCDRLDKALSNVYTLATLENLIELNGMVALTARVLKLINNPDPQPPLSGTPEATVLAA